MRIIAHLDMDAFFAAVEERDRPRLKGKPIVVGSDPRDGKGRGVVSTANYKAREYGIHSAMPITQAWKLSEKAKQEGNPEAVFISGSGRHYGQISKRIMAIIASNCQIFEQVSVDEAFIDLSFADTYKKASNVAEKIKKEIFDQESLTCSVGIGPNKLIAKIASDSKKPDGLVVVGSDDKKICTELIEAFLEPLPVRKIPGVGPKSELLLAKKRVQTVKDLKKFSEVEMEDIMGKWGLSLYRKIRGIDYSPVGEHEEVKSIGEQETFTKDTLSPNYILERVNKLSQEVFRRFKGSGFTGFRAVTVTVRFSGFETRTRSHTFDNPRSDFLSLEFEAQKLLSPFFDKRENPQRKLIRLTGVRIEKLK